MCVVGDGYYVVAVGGGRDVYGVIGGGGGGGCSRRMEPVFLPNESITPGVSPDFFILLVLIVETYSTKCVVASCCQTEKTKIPK